MPLAMSWAVAGDCLAFLSSLIVADLRCFFLWCGRQHHQAVPVKVDAGAVLARQELRKLAELEDEPAS
ncbi:hypothetical protein [Sphingobium sp.]|uniref:hypothetical protein n=1 Tax=Sphingobium sp. TaxID=1912891 RepID=UPI0028BE6C49|nr:hypothetical protein [Sphingobium sp.]